MDLCGLEEGHHEGLLVLGSVAPNQARQLGVDALPCKGGIRYRGVQGEGRGRGMILASPYNPFTATHSSGKDCLGNFRSCFRGALLSGDPWEQWKAAHNHPMVTLTLRSMRILAKTFRGSQASAGDVQLTLHWPEWVTWLAKLQGAGNKTVVWQGGEHDCQCLMAMEERPGGSEV